ncbi:hypothetical protein RYH80_18540 [Halobaculum sp. MBLA0147]|uniref:hypothetical protein n=1 Tax=Halobaculum sp. MBLA0147 TaxID=3079934 RepID=UPI00352499D3
MTDSQSVPDLYADRGEEKFEPVLTDGEVEDKELLTSALSETTLVVLDITDPVDEMPPQTAIKDGVAASGGTAVKLRLETDKGTTERTLRPFEAKKLGKALLGVGQHAEEAQEEIDKRKEGEPA